MKKTKVYWTHNIHLGFSDVVGYPPERLITFMKKDPMFSDMHYGKVISCPATLDLIRNTYVLRSPVNMMNILQEDGHVSTLPMGLLHPPNDYVHMDDLIGWFFFSEVSTKLTVTPPYLHPEGLSGAAGTYDISHWFRQVNPAIIVKDRSVEIKRGQPVLYVTFDKPVELVQFDITDRLLGIAMRSAQIKHTVQNLPLKYLYEKFKHNKANRVVMKEIRNNLL